MKLLLSALIFGCFLLHYAIGQEKPLAKQPSQEVVDAWRKEGFGFVNRSRGKLNDYPIFISQKTYSWKAIPKLPAPEVPFGLEIKHDKNFTDSDLKNLSGLTYLQSLSIYGCQIDGTGFKYLDHLSNLKSLNMRHTKLNDSGSKELAKIQSLEYLHFGNVNITILGLQELAKLKNLQSFGCHGLPDALTQEDIKTFAKMLPRLCDVDKKYYILGVRD